MKKKLLFCAMFMISWLIYSQNTYVPDNDFEQALINFGYDSGPLDDYVPTANINTVTDLNVAFYFISDLTGIEDFTALSTLDCSQNNLSSLDVSNNLQLTELYCWSNFLGNLDVSNNTQLTVLDCNFSQLSSLDVSNNSQLTNLNCSSNSITVLDLSGISNLEILNCEYNSISELDLSNHSALTSLHCEYNNLSTIDVSFNTQLIYLYCQDNNLNTLNVSQNTSLTHLYCYYNNLSSLDLSNNVSLTNLLCRENNIGSLDLSANTNLTYLLCDSNDLSFLDVKNGNNANVTQFRAQSNPNLTCINVDNAAWSTANWTYIDTQSYFDENCPAMSTCEFGASTFSLYPNPIHELLILDLIENANYVVFNLGGQTLKQGALTKGENELDLSNLTSGFYFIKVETNERSITKKFIKA